MNKRILLLTLHSQNNNFGSVLQAHSLYKYIKDLGYDISILNYNPYYSNGAINAKEYFKKILVNTLFLPFYCLRTYRFNRFVNYSSLTKEVTNHEGIREVLPDFNIFMVGSDQVWNPNFLCGRDGAYFFDFLNSKNKISYASSLGTGDLTVVQLKAIADKISGFKKVSVRENLSREQLMKYCSNEIEYVLDPVFLHDENYYRRISSKQKIEKGYILAYVIHKDPFISKVIDIMAKKMGKKVIQVGGFAKKCNYTSFPRAAGPKEFLNLVDNADYIITSSFHGTAFAHIYHKDFAVVMPYNNNLRIMNILQTAGTEDRVIKNEKDIEALYTRVNYIDVDKKLGSMIAKSKKYLKDILAELEV